MELKDTISLMTSPDYKDRFLAEYWQVRIRYDKLKAMYENWGNLSFTPTCPKEIYYVQLDMMDGYIKVLEERAKIEEIDFKGE